MTYNTCTHTHDMHKYKCKKTCTKKREQQQRLVAPDPRSVVRRRSEDALVVHVRAQQRQAGDTTLHGVIYSYMPRTVSGGRRVCAALTAERTELSEAGGGELGAAGDRDEAGGADSPSNGVRKLSQKQGAHAATTRKAPRQRSARRMRDIW